MFVDCPHCFTRVIPKPRHLDFANARMTFVVHKKLKQAMAAEEEGAG